MNKQNREMKKYIIIFIVTLAIGASGFAQLGIPVSQFSGNQLVFNPAYAGIHEALTINLSVHKSWLQLPGSPLLVNLNGHTAFDDPSHAGGWVFQNEQHGPLTMSSFLGSYAYKWIFDRNNIISFGLQAGALVRSVNWARIEQVPDPTDPGYKEGRTFSAKFDANVGV
jgi:type IX secretion system PorP/SprF family membrane protein